MKRGSKKVNQALKGLEIIEEHKLRKTLFFTIFLSFLVVIFVSYMQIYSQKKIVTSCSYFDPITIDLLAFFAALFLVIEGFVRIFEHPNASLKRQFTRMIRIVFGFSILTLHIIQFLHK
jgi:hypothetical protein